MDKLELDARVAKLERRVAFLSLFIPVILAGGAMMMFFSLRSRDEAIPASPTVYTTFSPTAPLPPPTPPLLPTGQPLEHGSAAMVAAQLLDLFELHRKSYITSSDFEAKKKQLFEKQMKINDLKADLERFGELQKRSVITSSEYERLKQQVLGLEK